MNIERILDFEFLLACPLTNDLSRAEEGVHNMNIWFGISVGLPTQTTCPPQ
jgi:hypothetical protein